MNPGKLNKRIQFIELTNVKNNYGGTTPVQTPSIETWGSLEPIRQYNQMAIEAGATAENGDRIMIVRYRKGWQPKANMLFVNLTEPNIVYTIKTISPYYPGTKAIFQNAQDSVYQDQQYIYVVGVRTDNSWINIHS
jgi:SPP1 family predicted phage head-tail adaptor